MNKFDDCIDNDNCVEYIDNNDCVDSSSPFDMSDPRTFSDPDKNTPIKYTYVITFSSSNSNSGLSIWFKPNDLKSKFLQLKNELQLVPVQMSSYSSLEDVQTRNYTVMPDKNYSIPDAPVDYNGSSWINLHFAEILNDFGKQKVSIVEFLKLEERVRNLEKSI